MEIKPLTKQEIQDFINLVKSGELNEQHLYWYLYKGGNINIKGSDCWTALTHACCNGHLEIVKLLVQNGANLNEVTGWNWTALHWACRHNHLEIVKYLCEQGVDRTIISNDGYTAYYYANDEIKTYLTSLDETNLPKSKSISKHDLLFECNINDVDIQMIDGKLIVKSKK